MIISVPAIYTCYLPKAGWLNLALVRQLQFDEAHNVAIVFWSSGDNQIFGGEDAMPAAGGAIALKNAWEEAQSKAKAADSADAWIGYLRRQLRISQVINIRLSKMLDCAKNLGDKND